MNPKAIVLDLDGTLLDSNKQVSPRNLAAVLACHNEGLRIIIATARPPRSVRTFIPPALLEVCAFVYYNGAQVSDTRTGFEAHYGIPQAVTAAILDYCDGNFPTGLVCVEVKDVWYANRPILDDASYNPDCGPEIVPLAELRALEATKVLLSEFDPALLMATWPERFGHLANLVVTDQNRLVQIMGKGVSKESGVMALCQHYGIAAADIMAFGDDYNDLELLRHCGYPIAMSNAVQELHELAYAVTASNDEDGVARVLEQLTFIRS
ncbi:HAD family hydrolase [Paenibacillus sp. HJGM_3]|uniref:HAD family hydrolase n=1 Tax=Paenibacillus sp. HJGM_3 TaxID=3379816 RepID=UPI00385A992A